MSKNPLLYEGEFQLFDGKPPNSLAFMGDDHKEVGRLSWENNILTFKGNAEESAKVFFKYLKQFFDKNVCVVTGNYVTNAYGEQFPILRDIK